RSAQGASLNVALTTISLALPRTHSRSSFVSDGPLAATTTVAPGHLPAGPPKKRPSRQTPGLAATTFLPAKGCRLRTLRRIRFPRPLPPSSDPARRDQRCDPAPTAWERGREPVDS